MKYFLCFLLFSSCQKQKIEGVETTSYNYILEDFNNDLEILGHERIDFSETKIRVNENTIGAGFCHEINNKKSGETNISIDKYFYMNPKHIQKLIIYHEIGHCFFGQMHTTGKNIMTNESIPLIFSAKDNILFYLGEMLK